MEKTSKELLKEFVNSQHFTSTTDIMNSMKELFSDVLQTVMEAELEEKLGYEKSERASDNTEKGMSKNYRNGYSKKTVKTQLALTGRKVQRRRDTSMPYSPQNDMDVYKLSAQLTIINRDNLCSIGEVEGKIRQLEREVEKARQSLNDLTAELDNLTALAYQAEEYFSLMDQSKRSPADELRLKMYTPILERSNITSRSDYEYLKSVIADTEQKAAPLKENFEKCSRLYDIYSEIAKTYYEISQGDYISRLVEEERQNPIYNKLFEKMKVIF